jgi:hypothetical protein
MGQGEGMRRGGVVLNLGWGKWMEKTHHISITIYEIYEYL